MLTVILYCADNGYYVGGREFSPVACLHRESAMLQLNRSEITDRDAEEARALLGEISDLRALILADEGRLATLWQSLPTTY